MLTCFKTASEAGVTNLTWVLKDRGGASRWFASSSWDEVYPALSKGNQEQIPAVSWDALALLVPSLSLCSCCCPCLGYFPEHPGPLLSPLPPGSASEPMLAQCAVVICLCIPFLIPSPSELGLLVYLVSDVIFLGGLRAHVLV